MAQKMKPGQPGPRRAWLIVGLIAVFLVGAGIALSFHRNAASSYPGLPPLPDLTGKPAELRQKLSELQARVHADRDTSNAIAALGRLYHANGFAAEAAACWQILHGLQPREGHWPYYLSDLSRTASDADGLRRWLEKTVEVAPDYSAAWLQLGDLAFKLRQFDAAESAFRQRLRLVPHDPYAAFGLARILLERGQRDEGKRALEELTRTSPEFPSAHNFYAELLHQDNDDAGAAKQRWFGMNAGRFRTADDPWLEELHPSCYDIDQLIVWGVTDFQTKHGDHGRALLERALRYGPDSPRVLETLGGFYVEEGEPEKAVEILQHGLQLPAPSEALYNRLCNAYLMLKRPAEALRVADQGLVSLPKSAKLLIARGHALTDSNRSDEAIAAFREAMTCAPGTPEPVTDLALTLLHSDRRDEAVTLLKRALEIQPQYAAAASALSELELDARRPDEAAKYIVPFFQQFSGLASARTLMSRLYLARALNAKDQGDYAEVERFCREGLASVPESAELHLLLGIRFAREKRLDDALSEFEFAYKFQPDDPMVVLSLGQVYHQLGRDADARRVLTGGAAAAKLSGDTESLAHFQQALQKLSR